MDRASVHADAAFLFGIEDLYGKFGFATTLPDNELHVWIARALDASHPPSFDVAEGTDDDQDGMMELYNRVHATRSWTRHRSSDSWHLRTDPANWRPGNEVVCLRRRGALSAYGIWQGTTLGQRPRDFTVHEAVAEDVPAARALLRELATRAWKRRVDEMVLREPPDSAVGQAARDLGCTVVHRFSPDGGGMSRLLQKERVLGAVSPELTRREAMVGLHGTDGLPARVLQGFPDDSLMRLLFGIWSWKDAAAMGAGADDVDEQRLRAWFPVPGSSATPIPHAHSLDHY
jgi:hypothetical protein